MNKDNVYDLFSRRKVSELLNTDANDRQAVERGRYVGVLPKGETRAIRETIARLSQMKAHIDTLVEEYMVVHNGYSYMLGSTLAFLGTPMEEFNPDYHDFHVDEAGHCWIVDIVSTQ